MRKPNSHSGEVDGFHEAGLSQLAWEKFDELEGLAVQLDPVSMESIKGQLMAGLASLRLK